MQVGSMLMFGVFVTLGTWGYLETFAPSDAVSGAAHALVLPVTWADSPRVNQSGGCEMLLTPLLNRPAAEIIAEPAVNPPAKRAPVIAEARYSIPLPVRSPRALARKAKWAAVPLPERSPGMAKIITAEMLPVRRPEPHTEIGARVAQAAEIAKSRRTDSNDADRKPRAAVVTRKKKSLAAAAANRAASSRKAVPMRGKPIRRREVSPMWGLGGPR